MEAEVKYIAKDGMRFDDPLKCQEYEDGIGFLPGTVGQLVHDLKKLGEKYIFGILLVKGSDDKKSVYVRATGCVDYKLESFVNIENLTEEQRYITSTTSELINELEEHHHRLDSVHYFIVYSDDIDLKSPGLMAYHNVDVWK